MNQIALNFSIIEICALLGMVQSIYVLVYIFLRSTHFSRAIFPVLFFLALTIAFVQVLAQKPWGIEQSVFLQISWFPWILIAPLSSLLVIQIARITKAPPFIFWPILLYAPCAYGLSYALNYYYNIDLLDALYVSGIIISTLSLLMIWFKRDLLDKLHKRKNGKERFWLIIALISLNIVLLSLNFFFLGEIHSTANLEFIRVLVGLAFLYVISTSLFRIYPPALSLSQAAKNQEINDLSENDIEIALKIENLLHVEKVYQEASYGRSDMARELSVSETQLSKIVNSYFQKNVPLLLNSLRVEGAKNLLIETDVDIAVVSEEAGFNSIATFNRVFKELTKRSPKEYRQKHTKM